MYDPLLQSLRESRGSLLETKLHSYTALSDAFKSWLQDTTEYTQLAGFVYLRAWGGIIDSARIHNREHLRGWIWQISSRESVWLMFDVFRLHQRKNESESVNYCTGEVMFIFDTTKITYCGFRAPWKYYSSNSMIRIYYRSDMDVSDEGEFKMAFQEGPRVRMKEVKSTVSRRVNTYKLLAKEDTRVHYYLLAHKLNSIVFHVEAACKSVQMALYDGPGDRSPTFPLRASQIFMSTSFVVFIKIYHKLSTSPCSSNAVNVEFKAMFKQPVNNCLFPEQMTETDLVIKLQLLAVPENQRCLFVPQHNVARMRVEYYKYSGPDRLLDNEHCVYGGLLIYETYVGKEVELVWQGCDSDVLVENVELSFNGGQIIIAAASFKHYSNVVKFEGKLRSGK